MKMLSRARRSKVPTSQNLEAAALFYLSRYAASAFSLRRVLQKRLRRAALCHPDFARDHAAQAALHEAIDAIVEKHKRTGILDDAAYAGMKAASARRAGRSARAIKMRLGQSGVASELAERALADAADGMDSEEAEYEAARRLAKKRKWGPFRGKPADPDKRRKELAAMARAGFSLDVARKVLGGSGD